jgi:hypothetical protein
MVISNRVTVSDRVTSLYLRCQPQLLRKLCQITNMVVKSHKYCNTESVTIANILIYNVLVRSNVFLFFTTSSC